MRIRYLSFNSWRILWSLHFWSTCSSCVVDLSIQYYLINNLYFPHNDILHVTSIDELILTGGRVAQWVRSLDLTTHTSLSPIRRGFTPNFVNYIKGCTRLAAASDKVYQLLAQVRWFSPASSTTKTGRHDIA